MSWASALKGVTKLTAPPRSFCPPKIVPYDVDWARLVSLDFESYWDQDYTLKKMSTSEYIRDPRFKAQMVGIKVGNGKTRIVPASKIKAELAKINWATHSLLAHNAQFDAFILSHHYGIHPAFIFDSLSMARGLHSNDIGAGLDEVSVYYGGAGKLKDVLEQTLGVLVWGKELFARAGVYCANDVDEMLRVFKLMLPKMPSDEIELIDLTCKMFTSPVLKVDIPRVEKELERELARREVLMYEAVNPKDYDIGGKLYDKELHKTLLKGPAERALEGVPRDMMIIKRIIGSNEKFADLLRAEGIEPPVKISPAWMKLDKIERNSEEGLARKYTYAFAKDDLKFTNLPHDHEDWGLDLNNKADVKKMVAKQERLQALVDVRIAVKSTTNVTRAQRFLEAGKDGMSLPCGYAYYRAHCLTGDAEVLTPSGWTRLDEWRGGEIAQWSASGNMKFAAATPNVFEVDEMIAKAESRYHSANYTLGHTLPGFTSYGTFTPRKAGEAFDSRFQLPISGALNGTAAITALDVQVAAMVQADGSIRTDSAVGRCVRFGFKKQRKIDRCRTLLDQAFIPYVLTVNKDGATRITIGAASMHLALKLLDEGTKEFSPVLLSASLEVKRTFIDELTHWDGDVEPHRKGFTYTTTNKANAYLVQTVAHLSEQSAFVSVRSRQGWSTAYRVYIRGDQTTRSIPKHYSLQRHTGKVYCPTTETGFFLMRQNGHIVVTGNTGRWGGQNKMNMQNLTRGGELRLSILAPKGHKIGVKDSGQIEARVNGWLWGQEDLLQAFRDADAGIGQDAYCNFAEAVYGYPVTKDAATKTERFVGKVCVLGLGFQMGAAKLQITFAKGALGGPPIFFELDRCKAIVNTYRTKNNKIRDGWSICARIIEDMAAGREGSHGPLNWEKETIWLPNGMALKYPDLRKSINTDSGWEEWTYASKDQRKKIYGGLLCENIVQALARIIVGWQMLQIGRKYRVVMTTHDEVVNCVKNSQAEAWDRFSTKIMKTAPSWCADIPLNCEGGYADNYSK